MTADIQAWSESGLEYGLEGGVAWLRLNRPAKRNAIDRPMRAAMQAYAERREPRFSGY